MRGEMGFIDEMYGLRGVLKKRVKGGGGKG